MWAEAAGARGSLRPLTGWPPNYRLPPGAWSAVLLLNSLAAAPLAGEQGKGIFLGAWTLEVPEKLAGRDPAVREALRRK